jgi:hypothetical protein
MQKIEILWSVLGGLFFSMLPRFFASGRPQTKHFDIVRWIERDLFDGFGYSGTFDEFLFGFFITAIIIWSVKAYKKR